LRIGGDRYNPVMVTLSLMTLFACLGAWWGWKVASVRLHTGAGPKWKRPVDVGRRIHAHRMRRRQQLWRLGYTGLWTAAGAAGGYGFPWLVGVLGGFLSDYM
jgi:hypothetical protein